MNEDIYDELVRVARGRDITYYSDVAPIASLDMSTEVGRMRIAQILGEISTSENEVGRPLLSAVVVLKEANMPGSGFFGLAEDLGRYDGTDDLKYWSRRFNECGTFGGRANFHLS